MRYGQAISEEGVGGMTKGNDGVANQGKYSHIGLMLHRTDNA